MMVIIWYCLETEPWFTDSNKGILAKVLFIVHSLIRDIKTRREVEERSL